VIETAPISKDELVSRFGCSRRLATRIAVLASKDILVSALLAEEARPGSALETFLLHPFFLKGTNVPQAFEEALADPTGTQQHIPMTLTKQNNKLLIAAEEELMVEDTPSQQAVAIQENDSTGYQLAQHSSFPQLPSFEIIGRDLAMAENGIIQDAFTPQEVSRLRINIFAGATSADKISALKQFAFTQTPLAEKLTVFLQALADPDKSLRSAAASGLATLGLSAEISDTARTLAEGANADREIAAERLADLAKAADELGLHSILMSLMGVIRDQAIENDVLVTTLDSLSKCVDILGPQRLCRIDIIRSLLERFLSGNLSSTTFFSSLFESIDKLCHGTVSSFFLKEMTTSTSLDFQSKLVKIYCSLPIDQNERNQARSFLIQLLLRLNADHDECRRIGIFLSSPGNDAPEDEEDLYALAESFSSADTAHQRYFIRLFDNVLRSRTLSAKCRQSIADACLKAAKKAPRQVRADLIETYIGTGDEVDRETRTGFAETFLQDLSAYSHWPLSKTFRDALARLGTPAVSPCLNKLSETSGGAPTELLAETLGLIGAKLTLSESSIAESILRQLQKLTFEQSGQRDQIHLSMGRIIAGGGTSEQVAFMITRSLIGRLQATDQDGPTLEAAALACCGSYASEEQIQTIYEIAIHNLTDNHPDPGLISELIEGEEMFHVGDEVQVDADLIPHSIHAIGHLICGKSTPTALREKMLNNLLDLWGKATLFKVVWSPANITRLTQTLGEAGADPNLPSHLRIKIALTLARRIGEASVLDSLTDLLILNDPAKELDRLAGSLILKILERLNSSGPISGEDREQMLRVLGKVCLRNKFQMRGGGEERLKERAIDALIAGLHQGVPFCLQSLNKLQDLISEPHAQRIKHELKQLASTSPYKYRK